MEDYNPLNKKKAVRYSLETRGEKPCVTKEISPPQKYKQFSNQQTKNVKNYGIITILALTAAPTLEKSRNRPLVKP